MNKELKELKELKDKKDAGDTKKTPPQPSPKGREEEKKGEDVNGFMITAKWCVTKHDAFSFDEIIKAIMDLSHSGLKRTRVIVHEVTDLSEETFNKIEAFGFDIIWKGEKTASSAGYYLINWSKL